MSLRRVFIFGEPQRLKKRKRDYGEQRVMMEAPPRSTLEVIEPEFLLHLLMPLLACPPSLDSGHDLPTRGRRRQVRQVILAVVVAEPLTHKPRGVSRQVN